MIWEIDDSKPAIEGLDAHGRPDPAYAAALGLVPAKTGMRVLAAVVEWAIGLLILLPALLWVIPALVDAVTYTRGLERLLTRNDLGWIVAAYIVSSVLMTVYLLVQLILHGRKGVTIGKAMFGIRSVNVRTLERPRFWRGAVVRYLIAWASLLVPVFGPVLVIALSPLFDPERRGRGWPDMIAGTWFVDVRAGLNPYDKKRMRIARKTQRASLHDERPALPSLATPAHRDAPVEYVPRARTSGGVLGAYREQPLPPPASGGRLASPSVAVAEAPAANLPVVPSQAEPAPSPRPVIVLDTGDRITVHGTTLIGRAPASDGSAHLVPIADETRSVSKTHLVLAPARRGLLVTDQGSTNGSAIVRAGNEQVLVPGETAELRAGDTVRFGDRSFTVENA